MNTTKLANVAEVLMKALSAGDKNGVKHSLAAAFAPEAFERRSLDQVQASLEEVLALSGGLEIELLRAEPHIVQAPLTTKKAVRDFRGVNGRRTMYFEAEIAPADAAQAGKITDFTLLAVPPASLEAEMKFADTPCRSLHDAILVNAASLLLFEPGSNWGYSNLGYMVLGRVIELLTNTSYEDYVEKHILAPAGMTETGNVDVTHVVPALAVGYGRQADDPLGIRDER